MPERGVYGEILTPLDASVSKIRYPDLTGILNQYPNPHILLGKEIVWQEKRDGCLHAMVELHTDRGSLRIKDIVREFRNGTAPLILTVNAEGQTEYCDVLTAIERIHTHPFVQVYIKYIKGSKPVGSVRMSDGYPTHRKPAFVVTENHRFKTVERGWVEARSLVPGDMVYLLSDKISYVQEQVILGTLLGDGSIYSSSSGNYGFAFSHGIEQYDYLKLKLELLGDLCKEDGRVYPGGYAGSRGTRRCTSPINTHINDFIKKYCVGWNDGKKQITSEWCQKLSPISLAIWYCDDGSLNAPEAQRPRAEVSTHCFNEEELNTLGTWLNSKFGLEFNRYESGAIAFTSDSSEMLFTFIAPYVPKSMQYKLPEKYRSGHCYLEEHLEKFGSYKTCYTAEVIRVAKPRDRINIRNDTMEYDIETANHNYFANGILVHNSNLRIYIDADGKLVVGSRNMDVASDQFYTYFKATPQYEGVEELLRDAENWNDTYVVFGELLIKGKSPTKIEFHDAHSFVVFDIWSNKLGGFFNYTKVYQECYHNHLPIVDLYGTCNVNTLESLLEFRDQMLEKSKGLNREGTVGKTWNGAESLYFKEKNDIPRYERVPRVEEDGKIILPDLPDSEITGAVEKVYTDLGVNFFIVGKAMPLVAEYVKAECQKHNCRSPRRKLFDYYQDRVLELRLEQEK